MVGVYHQHSSRGFPYPEFAFINHGANSTPVYAFETSSGVQAWNVSVGGIISAIPVLVGNVLIVATIDNGHATPPPKSITAHLYGLDASTGRRLWQKDLSSNNLYYYLLEAADSVVVVGISTSPQTTLIAVNPANGSQVWQAPLSGIINGSSIASGQGTTYVVETGILAIDSGTGKMIWQQSSNLNVTGLITFGDMLYAYSSAEFSAGPNSTNHIIAMEAETGRQIWDKTIRLADTDILGANDSSLFINQPSGNGIGLAALKASDGSQVWQDPFYIDAYFDLAITDTTLYGSFTVPSDTPPYGNTSIGAFDASTGVKIWSVPIGQNEGVQSVTLGNGAIFVVIAGQGSSQLEALKTSDGSTIWNVPLAGNALPVVIG